ncbi:uncharacterized protein LOC126845524 [Adelges cooleyi]|uniref:uncharacterized protein LOC126843888 n=1 Tax=Adelges cooleyi TaxID=133065 RepID=UPI00217FE2FA|nr:uncharacterized protein LOC126843888 [Adelges cooleyi]XP_050440140.1 uncharacterized protein LOC126845524 [Adelges cooleyi]
MNFKLYIILLISFILITYAELTGKEAIQKAYEVALDFYETPEEEDLKLESFIDFIGEENSGTVKDYLDNNSEEAKDKDNIKLELFTKLLGAVGLKYSVSVRDMVSLVLVGRNFNNMARYIQATRISVD